MWFILIQKYDKLCKTTKMEERFCSKSSNIFIVKFYAKVQMYFVAFNKHKNLMHSLYSL